MGAIQKYVTPEGGGGQMGCDRGGGVALRDVTPVEFFKFVKLALPYLLTQWMNSTNLINWTVIVRCRCIRL